VELGTVRSCKCKEGTPTLNPQISPSFPKPPRWEPLWITGSREWHGDDEFFAKRIVANFYTGNFLLSKANSFTSLYQVPHPDSTILSQFALSNMACFSIS